MFRVPEGQGGGHPGGLIESRGASGGKVNGCMGFLIIDIKAYWPIYMCDLDFWAGGHTDGSRVVQEVPADLKGETSLLFLDIL